MNSIQRHFLPDKQFGQPLYTGLKNYLSTSQILTESFWTWYNTCNVHAQEAEAGRSQAGTSLGCRARPCLNWWQHYSVTIMLALHQGSDIWTPNAMLSIKVLCLTTTQQSQTQDSTLKWLPSFLGCPASLRGVGQNKTNKGKLGDLANFIN